MASNAETRASVWDAVSGQERAVAQLRSAALAPVHAYLFVGPSGSTKDEAARAFAAVLLAGSDDPHTRHARLSMAGEHPDVREVERVGASITKEQVTEIIRQANMAPIESDRQVMIFHEFHLLDAGAAARLLKTVEEPPASTVFVVLADHVGPDLVTIASRCVRVDFSSIPAAVIVEVLLAEGVTAAEAGAAADAAAGNLDRARLLAADPGLRARRQAFAETPRALNGAGSAVVAATKHLFSLIDEAAAPLTERHAAELSALEARVKAVGERGSGRKSIEERQRRELRRHRTDEIRAGLATMAGTYRDALVAGQGMRPELHASAVRRIHQTIEALDRNPNEHLQLQALLLSLPPL